MCWMCDDRQTTFDDYVDEVVRPVVERLGFAVQATESHGALLAYTVGLTKQGAAELVVTGKPPDDAYDLLTAVLVGEETPTPGRRCDLVNGPALWAHEVLRPGSLVIAAAMYPRLRAVQLVWADTLGRWPWEVHRSGQRLLCDVGLARAA